MAVDIGGIVRTDSSLKTLHLLIRQQTYSLFLSLSPFLFTFLFSRQILTGSHSDPPPISDTHTHTTPSHTHTHTPTLTHPHSHTQYTCVRVLPYPQLHKQTLFLPLYLSLFLFLSFSFSYFSLSAPRIFRRLMRARFELPSPVSDWQHQLEMIRWRFVLSCVRPAAALVSERIIIKVKN